MGVVVPLPGGVVDASEDSNDESAELSRKLGVSGLDSGVAETRDEMERTGRSL